MSVFNLGVVFGPTLLRPQEETVAAILDIKFNNIVINILIENYERIFKTDPALANTTTLLSANASPPTRTPRASQLSKTNNNHSSSSSSGGVGGVQNSSRTSLYSPQQQVYRVMTKSNFTDSPMSSSLQNIPNGMIYSPHSNQGTVANTNGNGHAHHTNGSGPKSLGVAVNMGSIKNLHSMSQSDISIRRSGAVGAGSGGGGGVGVGVGSSADNGIYSIVSGTNGGLVSHHATPATASSSLRNDYLMATATPAATTSVGIGHSANHMYSPPNSGSRLNMNNVSPPTVAMRTEALYGTSSVLTGTAGLATRNASNMVGSHGSSGGMSYATAKHYSPGAGASTSSSNESVCDSLSSTNGGRIINNRSSMDYAPHASQGSSLSTLLGSTCDDIVTATAAPSMIGGHSPNDVDYVPQKMHRNKDVSQIKRDLSAGTA